MSAPSLEEIILGGHAYFIEEGTTVDSQTVSATIKPTVDPATNWTDRSLGDVLNFQFATDEVDISYTRALATGGFAKINRKLAVQDSLSIKTRQMGELVNRLIIGATAPITLGTAQTPGAAQDRKATGWLRLLGRKITGYDLFVLDWWCEVRVEKSDAFGEPKVMEPVLKFTQIKGPAGNSCNFPS